MNIRSYLIIFLLLLYHNSFSQNVILYNFFTALNANQSMRNMPTPHAIIDFNKYTKHALPEPAYSNKIINKKSSVIVLDKKCYLSAAFFCKLERSLYRKINMRIAVRTAPEWIPY